MPGGPPNLWALTDIRSAPSASEVDRHMAVGLCGIDMDQDAPLTADRNDLLDRLHGADLVIAPLHVNERGAVDRCGIDAVDVDAAHPIDRHLDDLAARALREDPRRFTHRGVLDRRQYDPTPAVGCPPRRRHDGLGRAAREHDLARPGPEDATRPVHERLRCPRAPSCPRRGCDWGRRGVAGATEPSLRRPADEVAKSRRGRGSACRSGRKGSSSSHVSSRPSGHS